LASHRAAAAADTRPLPELIDQARLVAPARDFVGAIDAAGGDVAVISEIKRRSPSKGDLHVDLRPADLAVQYEAGGAACMSVLTDSEWFGGSPDDLRVARGAVDLPVLRKDFTVSARDIADARIMGADCVLLIVAALDQGELESFRLLAADLGMAVLVEVHDEAELDRAIEAGANIIGVNQRDLSTFEVDQERAARVARSIPDGILKVAESGIRGRRDAEELIRAGFDALLVGETLVKSGDPAGTIDGLIGR